MDQFLGSNWTYLSKKRLKILKLLLFLTLVLQMCLQWKKPEVSIMFLRGDISIFSPGRFSEIVAILTAPAVCTRTVHIFSPFGHQLNLFAFMRTLSVLWGFKLFSCYRLLGFLVNDCWEVSRIWIRIRNKFYFDVECCLKRVGSGSKAVLAESALLWKHNFRPSPC